MAGQDINEYETQVIMKRQMDMLGGNMSVKDNMSNFEFMSQANYNPRQKTSQGGRTRSNWALALR